MGLFDRTKKTSETSSAPSTQQNKTVHSVSPNPGERQTSPSVRPTGRDTYIGKGIRIIGDIEAGESVHIDGTVEGHVRSDSTVTVGVNGRIKGNIEAAEIHVYGEVEGNIHADQRLRLYGNARIQGDVMTPVLAVAETAFIVGRVTMKKDEQAKVAQGKGESEGKSDNKAVKKEAVK